MKKQEAQTNTEKQISRKTLEKLPKIELHRHLEGSFRLETLIEFAKKRNLTDFPLDDPESFRHMVQMTSDDQPDFLTFLSKFHADWYSTLDDPKRLAYESVEDAAKENITYFEMRFSAEHYTRKSDFAIPDVIEAVIEGAREAGARYNILVNFLITMGREKMTPDEMLKYIEFCSHYHKHGVVGIDLAGDEIHYPPGDFANVFKDLYEKYGLFSTIHAGEAAGAENVLTAVNDLKAHRIGHGVRAIEDPAVVDLLLEKNILLEQCLTSNIQTATIPSLEKHPFPDFYKKGVPVTLNTDDPQIQQSDLIDDYELAARYYNFSAEDFRRINHYSLEGAFVEKDIRQKLLNEFDLAFDNALASSIDQE